MSTRPRSSDPGARPIVGVPCVDPRSGSHTVGPPVPITGNAMTIRTLPALLLLALLALAAACGFASTPTPKDAGKAADIADAGTDAGRSGPDDVDAGGDAGTDAGFDAGFDAGDVVDAGEDAGADAGADAGD